MNSSDTRLPDFLIADLYKNNLVITEEAGISAKKMVPQPKETVPSKNWWLGNNLQKITILVNDADAVHLKDESLQFLSSILGACRLNIGDVAIVNYSSEEVNYAFLKEHLTPAYVLMFGITTQQVQLPFTVPHYQVQKYDNCQFLLCPSLETMLDNSQEAKLEKSKLWICLKKMFNV